MAAPVITAVMDGLEARLATITGLRTSDVTGPINVTGSASQAIVGMPEVEDYRITMRNGYGSLLFQITVLTSAQFDRIGQKKLAALADFTGAGSVRTAIEADKTLGGIVSDTVVDSFRPLGLEEIGTIGYFGGVFSVRVITTGA